MMYRFYAQKVGNCYQIIGDYNEIAMNAIIDASKLGNITSNYCEIFIDPTTLQVIECKELQVPHILPEAFRAINDYNLEIKSSNNESVSMRKFTVQDLREQMQEIIDRKLHYGEAFDADIKLLLEKYPIVKEQITEETIQIG